MEGGVYVEVKGRIYQWSSSSLNLRIVSDIVRRKEEGCLFGVRQVVDIRI